MRAAQSKTAREQSRAVCIVKKSEGRLTLADQWRLIDRRAREIPAHAELEGMRGDALEGRRVDDAVGAVESPEGAGQTVAHFQIAISEFDGEVRRDLVGDARVQRPGENSPRH